MKTFAFFVIATAPLLGLWLSCVTERWQTGLLIWLGYATAQAGAGVLMLLGTLR